MNISLPKHSPLLGPGFLFGVGTSSYQIEGDPAGRLTNIWDTFCDVPGTIADGTNGEDGCQHVSRWREDVDLINWLGVDAYRLSIAWPRVIDEAGVLRQEGLDFYRRLLDDLLERGIKPFVTLYHWDLPQHIEDHGGWLERDTAYRFSDYADLVTRELADRVFSWATLNEPFVSAQLGYELGIHAPGITGRGLSAAHHLLLAHGLGMDVLRANCPAAECGIVLNMSPFYPASETAADAAAAVMGQHVLNQWYLHPVLGLGYPQRPASLPATAMPKVEEGDLDQIARPLDYLGINYYTREVVSADAGKGYHAEVPDGAPVTAMGWEVYPDGLRRLLVELSRDYQLPPLYITENGGAFDDTLENGVVHDQPRIDYLQSHLLALHEATQSGVDLRGYLCWSLMDNFEWAEGYSKRFGLVHIDYETQVRTPKASALAYRDLLLSRGRA